MNLMCAVDPVAECLRAPAMARLMLAAVKRDRRLVA